MTDEQIKNLEMLNDINQTFESTEELPDYVLPDGKYNAQLNVLRMESKTSTKTGETYVVLYKEFTIVDGEHKNSKIFHRNTINNEQLAVQFLKRDLKALGVDYNTATFTIKDFLLKDELRQPYINNVYLIQMKTKENKNDGKEYQNANIIKLLATLDEPVDTSKPVEIKAGSSSDPF